jgi:hypothetical protein
MASSFAAGRAKGYLQGPNRRTEASTGSLAYATEDQFSCGGKDGNSF